MSDKLLSIMDQFNAVSLARRKTSSSLNRTLTLDDVGCILRKEYATAHTVTVPPESDVAFLTDSLITIRNFGEGNLTITAGDGVTINAIGIILTN